MTFQCIYDVYLGQWSPAEASKLGATLRYHANCQVPRAREKEKEKQRTIVEGY